MDAWTEEQLLTKLERIAQALEGIDASLRRSRRPIPRGAIRRIENQIDYSCEALDKSLGYLERNTR